MNKQGKTNPLFVILIIAVIGFGIYAFGGKLQSTANSPQAQADSCGIATTFAPSFGDALSPSSSVSPVINAKINGGKNGTITSSSTLTKGTDLNLLLIATGYQKTIVDSYKLANCGTNFASFDMKAITSPTVKILTSPANVIATNDTAGSTQNITSVSAGGSLSFNLELISADKKTTGNMVVLVEMNSSVSAMTLDGVAGKVQKPSTYSTRVATNSQVFMFDVPAMDNSQDKVHNIVATMKSGHSYVGVVYVSVLGKDGALDSTGNYFTGIETSDGQTRTSAYDTLAIARIV